MYLVGRHIYYKMIHGPHSIKLQCGVFHISCYLIVKTSIAEIQFRVQRYVPVLHPEVIYVSMDE